jgi:hypothetical protein
LPDEASADTCDRLARRAICAWGASGMYLSGERVRGRHGRARTHRQRDRGKPSSLQTTAHFQRNQRPPLWHLGDTPRTLKLSVDWGRPEAAGRRPK